MTQQQRKAITDMLRASPFFLAGDPREQRPLFESMITAPWVPADVVTTPGQLSGVPIISVGIPGTTTDGVILYFHGGFFAIGSAAASVGLAADRRGLTWPVPGTASRPRLMSTRSSPPMPSASGPATTGRRGCVRSRGEPGLRQPVWPAAAADPGRIA
jgi:acetyl esterase/lipase